MNPTLIKIGSFTATASTATIKNINCGFIPDYVKLINLSATAADVQVVEWFREAMGDAKFVKHTIVADNGSTGNKSSEYVASGGITVLDTVVKEPAAWVASTAYVVGDIVRPTVNNGYFYKCTTAGTSGSSEPTWGTTVGGTTSDTAVWTCYNQDDLPVRQVQKQGFTIPVALQNESDVCCWMAIRTSDENDTDADY